MEKKPSILKDNLTYAKTRITTTLKRPEIGGLVILVVLALIVTFFIDWAYPQYPATQQLSNYTAPTSAQLAFCICQELCLFQMETEYCTNQDCEIYDINVPPCTGQTLVVRKTTRVQIDYIVPPSDFARCYMQCENKTVN